MKTLMITLLLLCGMSTMAASEETLFGTVMEDSNCALGVTLVETNDNRTCLNINPAILLDLHAYLGKNVEVSGEFMGDQLFINSIVED